MTQKETIRDALASLSPSKRIELLEGLLREERANDCKQAAIEVVEIRRAGAAVPNEVLRRLRGAA